MADEFAAAMEGTPCACIGTATADSKLTITAKGNTVICADVAELKSIWKNGLTPFY
jgi:phosphoribosylformylglycinamidine synthase